MANSLSSSMTQEQICKTTNRLEFQHSKVDENCMLVIQVFVVFETRASSLGRGRETPGPNLKSIQLSFVKRLQKEKLVPSSWSPMEI